VPAIAAEISGSNRRVVVIVWDGMRPDFVTEEKTPTLWKLSREGVNFRNNHAVYPSSTEVNGVALATGDYPGRSEIIANHEYRPEIDSRKAIDTESAAVVGKGDELSRGNYVACPTVAELVRKAGFHTAIAAAKGIGLLQDRHFGLAAVRDVTLFGGKSLPPGAVAPIVARLGPSPLSEDANRDNWATPANIAPLRDRRKRSQR
jgi:hypothetical protein